MKRKSQASLPGRVLFGSILVLTAAASAAAQAQLTPDDQARLMLDSARRAYNEKDLPFAVTRFREFLAKFGNHKDAAHARFGLGLSLLESPERDYNAVIEAFNPLAGIQDFGDRPLVFYYLGLAHRGLGQQALAQAAAKPQEAQQHRKTANQRFEQSATHFAGAMAAFAARVKPASEAKDLPVDFEWACRSRCDLAEMLLRTNKLKEALAAVDAFASDPLHQKSRYRGLGLYHHGHAAFLLKDHAAAARSLSRLAPFDDPVFGVHARYLLARVHQEVGDRPEAASLYEAVLARFEEQKKAAAQALQNPAAMKDQPEERARLETLAKGPTPEYVGRASFHLGVLLYEQGRFGESAARFAGFIQQHAGSPLVPDAQLRHGFCLVQLKQFGEAIKVLQPLEPQQPRLADQALLWLAKAQLGVADPNNAAAVEQAAKVSLDTLRRAAERAQQLTPTDADARSRRGEILFELGDTHILAKQYREAAAVFGQLQTESLLPERHDEALQRQAAALHLAGQLNESDQLCQRFQQAFAKSPLRDAVAFRFAENAYLAAVAADKNPNLPNRDAELKRLFGEAAKRYQQVIEKHPEFVQVNLARHGLALSLYRLGEFEKAVPALSAIPQAEQIGELATAPLLATECLLRTLPAEAPDALAAARAQAQLADAVKLLEGFLASHANHAQAPDALLKLGHAHQQVGELLAELPERNKSVVAARAAYDQLLQRFGNHPLMPQAVMERAQCIARMGDVNGAVNELNRFTADPLKNTPAAPVAVLRLSALLRSQNKPADAVKALEACRAQHEANLLKDAARLHWAAALQYHHALALKESGKAAEARGLFEATAKQFANRPEGQDAVWRAGQCRKEEALARIESARKGAAKPGAKPEELNAANAALQEGWKQLRDSAQYFQDQANQVKDKGAEPHLRLLYEAAWCHRLLAEPEIESARQKSPQKPGDRLPLQPAEQRARELYRAIIAAGPQVTLALQARLELAELLAEREELDPAIALLKDALSKEPSAELADRLRLRLAACLLTKNDPASAFGLFDALVQNPKNLAPELVAQARLRAAECLMQQAKKETWEKSVQYLAPFRDQPPMQNLPGLSDRALLRLGHAHGFLGQWDQSRQAFEILAQRFPKSDWLHEARYGIGWAWQNQKQFDNAVNAYTQVIGGTAAEVAARAQLQIGLCRGEQKRLADAANALLVVPFTYDYPELSALALCEASRVFVEMKQPQQASKLLERVLKDHAQSQWAEVAKQRLAEIR